MGNDCISPARFSRIGTRQGADNEQFLRAYAWDGKELKPTFDLDFTALKLGRPHHMLFGSTKIGAARTTVASK